jgi:hypothetical protein
MVGDSLFFGISFTIYQNVINNTAVALQQFDHVFSGTPDLEPMKYQRESEANDSVQTEY